MCDRSGGYLVQPTASRRRTKDSVSGGVRLGPLHFGVGVVDWFGGEVL